MTETRGKVHQTPGQVRVTLQPGLKNGVVWRKSGVNRKSEKVLARNMTFIEKMKGKKIATACKGKKRSAFFACLRYEGKKAWG
jgi:hypothetical protein